MKLAVDLQACLTDSRERGIGRYALGLVTALHALRSPAFELSVLLDSARPDRLGELRRRLRGAGVDAPSHCYSYPTFEGFTEAFAPLADCGALLKARFAEASGADVLLVGSCFEVGDRFATGYALAALPDLPKAVIAYDLIPLLFPERYLPPGQFISEWYRRRLEAFRGFDLYLAISQSTRDDLIALLGIAPERIEVIDAGIDTQFFAAAGRGLAAAELAALGIQRPFVLTVGNADWRKNCLGALEAFARLPAAVRGQHQLVFTRVGADVQEALDGSLKHLRESVLILGSVDEKTLVDLYASCRVFFFPSLYEGFGLPVLEAMAAGAPVLCASRGALPEVVHRPECLFDPDDLAGAAARLQKALMDEPFRALLLAGAREHAAAYGWERSARRALSALQRLQPGPARAETRAAWTPSDAEVAVFADALEAADPEIEHALRQGLREIAVRGRRRVLLDITEVVRQDARSGIQRVVRNYCASLAQLACSQPGFELVPFIWQADEIVSAYRYVRTRLGVDIEGVDGVVEAQCGDLALMLDSSWWSPERFDVFHAQVKAAGGEVVWMVYDLVPINTPQLCDPVMPPVFRTWLQHVADRADGCVCISAATEADLQRYFSAYLGQDQTHPWTRVVHLGSDFDTGSAEPGSEDVRSLIEQLQPNGYCVALSTIEPRKDYPTLLAAFEQLWAEGSELALVIIGKQGWNVEAFCEGLRGHPELGRRLHWLDRAGDGDVRTLLGSARCLIQASLAEGFGLAVVEAGCLGLPLLLSDIDVFREVAGDEASYFPTGDAAALAGLLRTAGASGVWRRPEGIRTLSWAASAKELLACLLGVQPGGEQAPRK